MCCDHCHSPIQSGTKQTWWDGAKHGVWVCAVCGAALFSAVLPGQASPQHEPLPIFHPVRYEVVDSGSLGTANHFHNEWYRQTLAQFRIIQDSDDDQFASLTVSHAVSAPAHLPEEKPNPENQPHPPHEGPTFAAISGSGAMVNTNASMMTTVSTWEPAPSQGHTQMDRFFLEPARQVMLKVGPETPRRPLLPRIRGSCK
jgi:hypothetical protein